MAPTKGAFINTLVGGLGKVEGAKNVLSYQKGGTKKFSVVKGGQKSLVKWKYNENQNAQFVAKINRI